MYKKLSAFVSTIVLLVAVIASGSAASAASISITSPSSGQSLSSSFAIAGTATANSSVQISVNGSVVGSTTSNGAGSWSYTLTGQTAGSKTIQATVSETPITYFAGFTSGELYAFDTSSNTQITGSPFSVGGIFGGWAVTSDGATAYVIDNNTPGNTYVVYDTENNTYSSSTVAGASLGRPVLSPDDSTLYFPDGTNSNLIVVDASSNTVTSTIALGGSAANIASITPDGQYVYVGGNSDLFKVNTDTEAVTTISAASDAAVRVDNGGNFVYVSDDTAPSELLKISVASDTVVDTDTIQNGFANLGGIAILPDDSKVYVSNGGSGSSSVMVYDVASGAITDTISTGAYMNGLDVTSDGTKVYGQSIGDIFGAGAGGGLWEIDTTDDSVTRIFATDDGSIGPVATGDFIVERTASDSVTAEVAAATDSTDTDTDGDLADTGINPAVYTLLGVTLVGSGLGLVIKRNI